ncbi:nucleic acid-binding protein [Dissoconium aciculare CBS 342.82]|uniref:Nucleic acid-binding protein n=1 Tax=Dissoconium aciculare CBS 342.82 TaxID=1314786 RepID=A0A6J3MGV6_9PEZI|nr:nucleic acid-binding protein [Dissoconium aciculare CBS 342.82]KAF1826919.1 nucleic acid-binding protein [Dissoconium aciculare CBS 342.82]
MAPVKRKAIVEDRPSKKSKSTDNKETTAQRKPAVKSAKPEKASKPAEDVKRPELKSVLQQEDRAFPRGGGSILTPLEHKQIRAEAERDVLLEQENGQLDADENLFDDKKDIAAKKKRKASQSGGKGKEKGEPSGHHIQSLSYKTLVVGSVVLGRVTAITNRDVAISLANNLTGFVPLTSISERLNTRIEKLVGDDKEAELEEEEDDDTDDIDLKKLFHLGQWLRATVSASGSDAAEGGSKSKRHIELTLDPSQVNGGLDADNVVVNSMVQGSVRSVEDHGIIMDLGLSDSSIKGFIGKKELVGIYNIGEIQEGQVMLTLVTGKGSDGKVLKLTPNPNSFSVAGAGNKLQAVNDAPTIDGFQPGTAIDMLITESSSKGVVGKIMGVLDASADVVHSGGYDKKQDSATKYKVGTKTKARIIWTLPKSDGSRTVGVSLLEHVLTLTPPVSKLIVSPLAKIKTQAVQMDQQIPLSTTLEDAKVVHVSPERGVFLSLIHKSGKTEEELRAFAHISQLSDQRVESILSESGPFKIDSRHKVRVLSYNPIDNFYYVSMKPSILEQTYLRVEDVPVGEIVRGTIEKLILGGTKGVIGVLVKITDHITGLIPEMHLSDVQMQHPERKFREGLPIKARVLSVDLDKRHVRLTAKKTLVNADNASAIWKDYQDLTPGMESQGTILKLTPSGAVVQFFGKVRAFLPVAEMSESFIRSPETHFRLGQTVNVRILTVNPDESEMRVSCKDDSTLDSEQQAKWDSISAGNLVSGTVTETTADTVKVDLENGLHGTIKIGHLIDGSANKAESALKRTRIGQKMSDLLVLQKATRSQILTLSNKSSLIEEARSGNLITQFSDVKPGTKVRGFIRNIVPEGVYVEFANGVVGMMPKSQIPPEMLTQPLFGLRTDQTLLLHVIFIDNERERFSLSLREQKGKTTASTSQTAASEPVQNPADESITSLADFTLGKVTKARISSVKSTQLQVRLADGIQGRVDISEAFDSWDEISNKKAPLQKFKQDEIIDVKILGIFDARSHRFLPISHRSGMHPVFELSAKRSRIENNDESLLTLDSVAENASYPAFVNNHGNGFIWVHLSPNIKAPVSLIDVSNDAGVLQQPVKHFPVGTALLLKVKSVDTESGHLELAADDDSVGQLTFSSISPGMILPAKVTTISERSINVKISDEVMGPVHMTEISDDYDKIDILQYNKNDIVRVCIISVDPHNKRVVTSLRPSKVLSSSLPIKDAHITNASQLKAGDIVRGFVKKVAEKGVFVSLGANVDAMVWIADLSDQYVKDWKSIVEINQMVKGRIVSVDSTGKFIQMSLKPSQVDPSYRPPLQITDLEVSAIVTGKVRKVEDFGAFIDIDNTQPRLSGLCHRSEMASKPVADARKIYSAGDVVKAKILKVDVSSKKISLGLKASYFEKADDVDGEDDIDEDIAEDDDDDDEDLEDSDGGIAIDAADDESELEDTEMADDGVPVTTSGLKTSGFDWSGNGLDTEANGAVSESEAEDTKTKKRKKNKAEIKVDHTGDLDKNGPQSVSDFERQLLGQPNNSGLWIQYMAFQLELSEVQKARDIAERALRSIHIRETEEKANIWIAWLNLEVAYGDDDSVEGVFKEACQLQDSLEMHQKLASIYIDSGKLDKADDIFRRIVATKSFRASPDIWLNYATFLMDSLQAPDRARALLTQSHQSIPKTEQRPLTAKFAALEFHAKHGDPERGRTIFEGLITEWPKWSSGWDTWVDLERARIERAEGNEAKKDAREKSRALFERMAAQKMKKRRALFVFKRWLAFETEHGSSKQAERVKALAAEFVQNLQQGGGAAEGREEDD